MQFSDISFDQKLGKFFIEVRHNCRVADIIVSFNNILKNVGNYVTFVDATTVSYIPKSKIEPFSKGKDRKKCEVNIKIGRFITRFLKEEIMKQYVTPADIENFVNEYKSYFECDESLLRIVQGEEILHCYLEDNYLVAGSGGTLWKSCMRQRDRNSFMTMYKENNSQLLVFFTTTGKVRARALLWTAYDKKDQPYLIMDRIYSIYDHDVKFFKTWAQKNGYLHKYEQSANNEYTFIDPKGDVVQLDLRLKLTKFHLEYYPYLDTFKFFDPIKGILYNTPNHHYQYVLVQSDGSLEKEDCEGDEIEMDLDLDTDF